MGKTMSAYQKAKNRIQRAKQKGATKLDLSRLNLSELPEDISQLTQLQELNLHSNQLTALPESLGQFSQLQQLYLGANQLTALPEALGQLTQLQRLYLHSNQLTALPESLGQLTQLQRLYLSDNQLTALPEALGRLSQLQELELSNNSLEALPPWITEFEMEIQWEKGKRKGYIICCDNPLKSPPPKLSSKAKKRSKTILPSYRNKRKIIYSKPRC